MPELKSPLLRSLCSYPASALLRLKLLLLALLFIAAGAAGAAWHVSAAAHAAFAGAAPGAILLVSCTASGLQTKHFYMAY